jgi:hypothetical protein
MMYKNAAAETEMSEMVRKQFYIHKRQQILLRQLSQARGVSEAEIVRQAIEREAAGESARPPLPDRAAWDEVVRFVESRLALGSDGEPYRWSRQDAYEERESRFAPPRAE